jgi:hypothetical protein
MSEFIKSFFKIPINMKKYKICTTLHIDTQKWLIHILPTVSFYFETHSPIYHKRFWKDGISGLYLSAQWFTKTIIIGIYKKII